MQPVSTNIKQIDTFISIPARIEPMVCIKEAGQMSLQVTQISTPTLIEDFYDFISIDHTQLFPMLR